jgi:hypothetical protein
MREKRPSAPLVLSIIAVVLSLAGTGVASVATISALSKKEKKQTRNIANDEIGKAAPGLSVKHAGSADTAATVADGAVTRAALAPDQRTEWAVVNADKTIAAQSGGISWVDVGGPQTGQTHLHFPDPLGTRPIVATIHGVGGAIGQISATRCGDTPPGGAVCSGALDEHNVFVETANTSGTLTNMKFTVVVLPG